LFEAPLPEDFLAALKLLRVEGEKAQLQVIRRRQGFTLLF
jgi:hypothetical protein